MLLPARSTVWSVMMPSTVTTAIFRRELLSSSTHSSSRGPTSRVVVRKPLFKPELNPEVMARETNWVKFPNRLMTSSTSRMIAAIIQPQLLRGLTGGGGAMIGGGVNGAGGGGTLLGGKGGVSMSIACPN